MAGIKKESLSWIDQLNDLKTQLKGRATAPRPELKQALKFTNSKITDLININACFDQLALDKVRKAAKEDPDNILSFRGARAIAGLKDKVANLPKAVHEVLDVAISKRLITIQIEGLVGSCHKREKGQ